ncbi:MAG: hypothetical protein R2789_12495 [Microthrixaceae bacterium]
MHPGEVCASLPEEISAVDQRAEVAERWELWRNEKTRRLGEESDSGCHRWRCSMRWQDNALPTR